MERIYGELLEQRLFAVRGIREINQVARTGRMIGTVGFEWDADMDFALVEVEKADRPDPLGPGRGRGRWCGTFRSAPGARRDDVGLLTAEEGGPDLAELRLLARRQVAIALERLEGVAEVRVTGGRERELRVEIDRYKLEGYGLSLAEVERRLQEANVDINAGTLEEGNRVYMVRGLSRYRKPADVAAVVVRFGEDASGRAVPIRVGDIAGVRWGDREISHLVRVDGREGVGLAIYKEAGANTVAVSETVRRGAGRPRGRSARHERSGGVGRGGAGGGLDS